MSPVFFVHHQGQQAGPLSVENVAHAINSGTYSGSDLAWHEGLPEWVRLDSMEHFAACFPKPPPQPLPQAPAGTASNLLPGGLPGDGTSTPPSPLASAGMGGRSKARRVLIALMVLSGGWFFFVGFTDIPSFLGLLSIPVIYGCWIGYGHLGGGRGGRSSGDDSSCSSSCSSCGGGD